MTKTEEKKLEKAKAKEYLTKLLEKNKTVYTLVRHVSRSGMQRHISCFVPTINSHTHELEIVDISFYVSKILDIRRNKKNNALIVNGCGMDMGFHVVNSLSVALYCYENGNFEYTRKGAYALDHRWL